MPTSSECAFRNGFYVGGWNIPPYASVESRNRMYATEFFQRFVDRLPNGIHTKVAMDDPNISVDHKQRISLARAVYSDAQLILMDDPLSAMNVRTRKRIFDSVIGSEGVLRNKVGRRSVESSMKDFLEGISRMKSPATDERVPDQNHRNESSRNPAKVRCRLFPESRSRL